METLPRLDIPHPTRRIVTPADHLTPGHIEAAYARGVALEYAEAEAELDVPDAQGGVARAGDGDRTVGEDADGADGGGVSVEDVDTLTVGSELVGCWKV